MLGLVTTKTGKLESPDDLKRAMAQISVKSHDNGAKNPKAHLRNKINIDTVLGAPTVAEPLGAGARSALAARVAKRAGHHGRSPFAARVRGRVC